MTSARFVLLEHVGDPVARALAAELGSRHGDDCVVRLEGESLAHTSRWEHRVDSRATRTVLNGLDSDHITAVVNRLHFCTPDHLAGEHQDYAAAEMNALLLSWLHSLRCPILNRPVPGGLAGAELSYPQWLRLAADAGLLVGDYYFTTDARRSAAAGGGAFACASDGRLAPDYSERLPRFGCGGRPAIAGALPGDDPRRLLVAGSHVFGAAPDTVVAGAARLAEESGFGLLELWFNVADWKLAGVQPFPVELNADEIAAVATMLEGTA